MTEYEAVFWDIGGVILELESVQRGHRAFIEDLVDAFETDCSPGEAAEIWRSTLGEYFRESEGTNYRPARHGYRQAVDAVLAVDADSVDWESLFEAAHDEHARPHPGAVETIERLAGEVHLGVISDVDHEEGQRLLDGFGVLDSFDSFTSSEEVGKTKPDQAIFDRALGRAAVDPERAAMIGDRYSHDMQGGREAGMTTIAYGADDGPAVDYVIDDLSEVLSIVGIEDSG